MDGIVGSPGQFQICECCGQPYGTLPPIALPAREPAVTPALETKIAQRAATRSRSDSAPKPRQAAKPPGRPAAAEDAPFGHPTLGERLTVCVLLYGNYHELHRSCLGSIVATIPPARRQLRVACNAVCDATLKYLSQLRDSGQVHRTIVNRENLKKYPAMRQLFYDEQDPITDRWIIWFDDDTIANRDPTWFTKLAHTLVHAYPSGARQVGALWKWTFQPGQVEWIKSRPWYRNRHFQTANGSASPNGNKVVFVTGGFFALETAAMKTAGIPDPQIGHNGGDYMISEQLWQTGFRVHSWNSNKRFVFTSSVKRRGLSEIHTGRPNWVPAVQG